MKHGTQNCYKNGCRNPECCAAHAKAMREYHHRRREGRAGYRPTYGLVKHLDSLRGKGLSDREIARRALVNRSTISLIRNGQSLVLLETYEAIMGVVA